MSTASPWNARLYDGRHSFVWKLAGEALDLLAPVPGERVIDLGCGTGHLTAQIAERGAEVIGVDASPEMIAEARRTHPGVRFEIGDGRTFELGADFDAVFSNAALHWMPTLDVVFCRVHAHLRPGGRFVFEMGGARNLQAIHDAVRAALHESGAPLAAGNARNTYLSVAQACALLDGAGFEVHEARWIERPTPLDGEDGLRQWMVMFGGEWLKWVREEDRESFLASVERHARPSLWRDGIWIADYKRLRVQAVRQG
jgi:trans-aconitate methyltransferase